MNKIITQSQIITEQEVDVNSNFIEANTIKVSLNHLKNDCVIPVFAKDNESTISHYQFISTTFKHIKELFPDLKINQPDIRVSHIIKGRIPTAIGKPAKELMEHEKTIYYERCAFTFELPEIVQKINGNDLALTIGGVRSYSQENLYSKKTLEKFKVFIGFKNKVCTNLCITTDGFTNEIRIGSIGDLKDKLEVLIKGFNKSKAIEHFSIMSDYRMNNEEFAHFIGKCKMYQQLDKNGLKSIFPMRLNDSQISQLVREYYNCPNFGCDDDGYISLWKLYNLLTEANKSSYIDTNLERNVSMYELINNLVESRVLNKPNWFLHYNNIAN